VPHETGGMTTVENPTQSLRKHIHRIHDSRKVDQDDVLHKSPMLKCKIFDFDMTRAIRGSTVVDDLDCGIVIFVDGSGLSLSAPQFMKNESQIFGNFRCGIRSDEFGLCRALCTDGLYARAIGYDTTGQTTSASRCRMTLMQFVSMRCINVSNQLSKMGWRRNDWQRFIELHENMQHLGKSGDRFQMPMHNAPVLSLM